MKRLLSLLLRFWHTDAEGDIYQHTVSPGDLKRAIEAEEHAEEFGLPFEAEVIYRARRQLAARGIADISAPRARQVILYRYPWGEEGAGRG